MLYYDDRDYFYDSDSIDDLYDNEDPDTMFEDHEEDSETISSQWEYDYHRMTDELIDD
jgi:hypothetical protein